MTKKPQQEEANSQTPGPLPEGNSIDTWKFEKATYEGRYDEAFDLLCDLLESIDRGAWTHCDSEAELVGKCTRIAAVITALFANPTSHLTGAPYRRLTRINPTLTSVFACSAFGDADHMLHMVSAQFKRSREPGPPELMKLLASITLETNADMDIGRFIVAAPDIALPAYFGMLWAQILLTERSFEHRKHLLELGPILQDYIPRFENLYQIALPWFQCSYDDSPDKHAIKKNLNEVIKKSMASIGVHSPSLPTIRSRPQRPTIMLPMERFDSHHAMYRCYAPCIRQLRDRFRLVMVCETGKFDQPARNLFDEIIEYQFVKDGVVQIDAFRTLVDRIGAVAPDITYYPSIGMSPNIIALANLRLAPLQVMSLGHPATANTATIDYVAIEQMYLGNPSVFHETVVMPQDGSGQMELPPEAVRVAPTIRRHATPLRLVVPSKVFKLNPRFLATCREINDQSPRELEFHFMPNTVGLAHHHACNGIRDWLPQAVVHPSTDYDTYITNLNSCDISLSPFPFGGANSNIDALRQGIPLINLRGDEAHSGLDAGMLHHIGAPGWLTANTREEYVQAALRLICDDAERVEVSRAVLRADIDAAFLDSEYTTQPRDFVRMFWWLFQNHEEIQRDGRKSWTPEEQTELAETIRGKAPEMAELIECQ